MSTVFYDLGYCLIVIVCLHV